MPKKKYFRPYLKGTNIPAFELPSDMCFASREDCEEFLKNGNPFYSEDRYEICECERKDKILDNHGNLLSDAVNKD